VIDRLQFPVILDWIFRRKTEWLAKTNQRSVWRDTNLYKNFLVAVSQTEMTGQLQLFVLKLNDEFLSAALCRISKLRLEMVVVALDQTYGKYGLGQLIHEDVLKWAFERSLDCDFRLGNQPHKLAWTNSSSEATTYHFVNSVRGATFIAARKAYQAGKAVILGHPRGER
jgi:CelD/BcsL family acetyltransferase involved in cellulose biosynthesis